MSYYLEDMDANMPTDAELESAISINVELQHRRISFTSLPKVQFLDAFGSTLYGLPSELPNCLHLDIRETLISELPLAPRLRVLAMCGSSVEYVENFTELTNLLANDSRLVEVVNTPNLEVIEANLSMLEVLPDCLPRLKKLEADGSFLIKVPSCPKLVMLDVCDTDVSVIPGGMDLLEYLDVSRTMVEELPPLPSLQTLIACDSELKSIPPLPSLTFLNICNTSIEELVAPKLVHLCADVLPTNCYTMMHLRMVELPVDVEVPRWLVRMDTHGEYAVYGVSRGWTNRMKTVRRHLLKKRMLRRARMVAMELDMPDDLGRLIARFTHKLR